MEPSIKVIVGLIFIALGIWVGYGRWVRFKGNRRGYIVNWTLWGKEGVMVFIGICWIYAALTY